MESDRFDDVGFRMIEEPAPPPRRRPGRRAAVAAILAVGAFAVSATALASQDAPEPPAAAPSLDGSSHFRHNHGGCHHGLGRHHDRDQDTTLRF